MLTEQNYLLKFIGEYEWTGKVFSIVLQRKDVLILKMPEQLDYQLVPYKENEFNLKNLTGNSIVFKTDEKGNVVIAYLKQPDGIYQARRK